jgi:hypothetical protein
MYLRRDNTQTGIHKVGEAPTKRLQVRSLRGYKFNEQAFRLICGLKVCNGVHLRS